MLNIFRNIDSVYLSFVQGSFVELHTKEKGILAGGAKFSPEKKRLFFMATSASSFYLLLLTFFKMANSRSLEDVEKCMSSIQLNVYY